MPSKSNSAKSSHRTAIICVIPGEGLGAETVLEEMLLGWDVNHHPLTIVSPPGSRIHRVGTECGLKVVDFSATRDSFLPNLQAAGRLRKQLGDCTALHAWGSRAFESTLYLGRRLDLPVYGTLLDHANADFHGSLRRKLMKFSANRFTHLVGASQAVIDVCRENGYTSRMSVIYTGLNDLPVPKRTEPEYVRVGFLGMYAAWKGFALIKPWIEDTAKLPATWKLYGNLHTDVEPHLTGMQSDRFELCGRQPTEEIFKEIDFLVHASTHFDPFPTVLIEAARAGIPVVASDDGGSPEMVVEDETGFLFNHHRPEPGLAAVRKLIAEPEKRREMGHAARTRFETGFRVPDMVQHYHNLWTGHA